MDGPNPQPTFLGADEWWGEFIRLSNDRQISAGMGLYVGPIPSWSIERAAKRYPGEERDFEHCIRMMDAVFRDIQNTPEDKRVSKRVMTPALMMQMSGKQIDVEG